MVPVPIDPEERRRARQAYRQLAGRPRDGDVGLWSNRHRERSKLRAGDLQALAHMLGLAMTNAEATRTAQALATRASGGDDGEDAEQVIPWSRFLRWWAAVRTKVLLQLFSLCVVVCGVCGVWCVWCVCVWCVVWCVSAYKHQASAVVVRVLTKVSFYVVLERS
jgi:hypothetical protein